VGLRIGLGCVAVPTVVRHVAQPLRSMRVRHTQWRHDADILCTRSLFLQLSGTHCHSFLYFCNIFFLPCTPILTGNTTNRVHVH
jgi:hypothetical protein